MAARYFQFWKDEKLIRLFEALQEKELDQAGMEDIARTFPGITVSKAFRHDPGKLLLALNAEIEERPHLFPERQVKAGSATVVFERSSS